MTLKALTTLPQLEEFLAGTQPVAFSDQEKESEIFFLRVLQSYVSVGSHMRIIEVPAFQIHTVVGARALIQEAIAELSSSPPKRFGLGLAELHGYNNGLPLNAFTD